MFKEEYRMDIYLESFDFITKEEEDDYCFGKANSDSWSALDFATVSSHYPYRILSSHGLFDLEFEPITILFGDNGCGKSTALNIIASKINASRKAKGNSSVFFDDYLRGCHY